MNTADLSTCGFGYESPDQGAKTEWLTPRHILSALGEFDLDPCSPIKRPWPTANEHFTVEDDGLVSPWGTPDRRVFLNPPYTRSIGQWLEKMVKHGNGIALIFARTETSYFTQVWPHASAYLFLQGRLKFHHVDGTLSSTATAPSVLIAFDNRSSDGYNAKVLQKCSLRGARFGRALL